MCRILPHTNTYTAYTKINNCVVYCLTQIRILPTQRSIIVSYTASHKYVYCLHKDQQLCRMLPHTNTYTAYTKINNCIVYCLTQIIIITILERLLITDIKSLLFHFCYCLNTKIYTVFLMCSYLNLLQFVVTEMLSSTKHLNAFFYWRSELVNILQDEKPDHNFCIKLVTDCKHFPHEAIHLVSPCLSTTRTKECLVRTGTELAALAGLVQHGQLQEITVDISTEDSVTEELEELLSSVQQHFTGVLNLKLYHSFLEYQPCDNAVSQLLDARSVDTSCIIAFIVMMDNEILSVHNLLPLKLRRFMI